MREEVLGADESLNALDCEYLMVAGTLTAAILGITHCGAGHMQSLLRAISSDGNPLPSRAAVRRAALLTQYCCRPHSRETRHFVNTFIRETFLYEYFVLNPDKKTWDRLYLLVFFLFPFFLNFLCLYFSSLYNFLPVHILLRISVTTFRILMLPSESSCITVVILVCST